MNTRHLLKEEEFNNWDLINFDTIIYNEISIFFRFENKIFDFVAKKTFEFVCFLVVFKKMRNSHIFDLFEKKKCNFYFFIKHFCFE